MSWHGGLARMPDWSRESRSIAFMLAGPGASGEADAVYVALNMDWEGMSFGLPDPPRGLRWHVFANTGVPSPEDAWSPGSEPPLGEQGYILATGRSAVVLVAR